MHYSKTAKNTRIQDFRGSEKGFRTINQTSANNRFMTLIILAALQIYSRCSLEEAYRNLHILVLQESLMTWPYDLMTSVLDAYILKDNIYQKCHLAKGERQKAKGKGQFSSRRHLQECVRPPDSLFSGAPSECWFPDSPSMEPRLWCPAQTLGSPQMISAPPPWHHELRSVSCWAPAYVTQRRHQRKLFIAFLYFCTYAPQGLIM